MVHTLVLADEVAPELTAATLRDLAPQLVLTAGDLPWDHVEWVSDTVECPVVYVPGNHDSPDHPPRNVIDADRRVVEVAGLRIAGLGGCVRYREGPFQFSQREYTALARKLVRAAAGPVDVLLTHTPPHGLGDGDDAAHVGIEALHDVIEQLEPTWHLHGHIHPFGLPMPDRQVGRTTVRNVIPWNVVEIESRTGTRARTMQA